MSGTMSTMSTMADEFVGQLSSSGPAGVAAAAAIVSARKRNGKHVLECNPKIRKRVETRLLRRLRQVLDEFSVRVGQQAAVVIASPGCSGATCKVFGSKPLEDVMKNYRGRIMEELDDALACQAFSPQLDDPSLFVLPPLMIDGIPTPLQDMTQNQLRAFIPLMLKYSTGRSKPGYGKVNRRPPWWPADIPWANVRTDTRSEMEKQRVSFTKVLRQIVLKCYEFHGRVDMLPALSAPATTEPASTEATRASVQNLLDPDYAVMKFEVGEAAPTTTPPNTSVVLVQGVTTFENVPEGEVKMNKYCILKEGFVDEQGRIIVTGHTLIPVPAVEVQIRHCIPGEGPPLSGEGQATAGNELVFVNWENI